MRWSDQHDMVLCKKMLANQLLMTRNGTKERGQHWEKLASDLNMLVEPQFFVNKRSVRDRFLKLRKNFEKRLAKNFPGGLSEQDLALREIVIMSTSFEEDVRIIENSRKRSVDSISDTSGTEQAENDNTETGMEKRAKKMSLIGSEHALEISEFEEKLKMEELELRKKEIKLKEKKLELMEKELGYKENGQETLIREQEERTKKLNDIIIILKQQIEQQQTVLVEVQQQNQLLLSLYQKSLEKD